MPRCKCRFCQASLLPKESYKETIKKQVAYFCNEEHYSLYLRELETQEQEKQAMKELIARQNKEKKLVEKKAQTEKYKADKDKAYWLICEIINRDEIINTVLWKEWSIWNKVASNEVIGQYLEENKNYLIIWELISVRVVAKITHSIQNQIYL